MTVDYRVFQINASASWQNTGLEVSSGSRVTIIPLNKKTKPYTGIIPDPETLSLPSTQWWTQYMENNTVLGLPYSIEVGGTINFHNGGTDLIFDSFFHLDTSGQPTGEGNPWVFENDQLAPRPSAFQSSHVYQFEREGTGAEFGFRIPDNPHFDNVGGFSFEIAPLFERRVPTEPDNAIIARLGESGVPFAVGKRYEQVVSASGHLYFTINKYALGSAVVLIIVNAPAVPDNEGQSCEAGHTAAPILKNPIELRTGDKRLSETDLVVQTPAGPLAFNRAYRQSQQDNAAYQFMGLGWSHNHQLQLTLAGTSPNRTAEITVPEVDILKLEEDSANAGEFNALSGSTATMLYEPDYYGLGQHAFVLTLPDKTLMGFLASTGQIQTREWINHEVWTYSYASGKLSEVDDGYGRQLKFSYINNPSGFDDGQLWRVGDQTADDLDTSTPTGRYVEFGYDMERADGTPVTNPKALLATVQDVRGNTWSYDYYGQTSGETNADLLNFLLRRISPSVDTTGDEVLDGTVDLEQLTYQVSGAVIDSITQKRGVVGANPPLEERLLTFQPDGENMTLEEMAGRETTHHFANGVYVGPANPAGDLSAQVIGEVYRPIAHFDANGNETALEWSTDARRLDEVEDALQQPTSFDYNSNDTLNFSLDAEERKTQYVYGDTNNPRLPTEVKIIAPNGTMVLRWQKFSYDNQGRTLTEEVVDPANGTSVLRRTTRDYYTSGDEEGFLQYLTQEDLQNSANDVTTIYFYDSAGRVVQVNQNAALGSCSKSYTVYDAAGNVVASVCNYENTGAAPTTAAEAVALYDPQTPEVNRVTTHAYDPLGRRFKTTVNAGAAFAQTSLTVLDALGRVVRTIRNYVPDLAVPEPFIANHDEFDHGTAQTQNLVTDTAYNERGLVRLERDVLGSVTLYGYDEADRLVRTIQSASQPEYDNTYGVSGDPDLSEYETVSDADLDIVTTQAYDPAGNLVQSADPLGRISFTVYDALNRPIRTVRSARQDASLEPGTPEGDDPRSEGYLVSTDPDRDLLEETDYDALGRVIRTRRLLENRGTEDQWDVTLFGYDTLGRQVKVIRSASQPEYAIASDPDLSGYSAEADPDLDLISRTAYDLEGRVLYTEDVSGERTWQGYDGLGRQIRTVRNYTLSDDSFMQWVWDPVDERWEDALGQAVEHGENHDLNLIAETVYDEDGRVKYTRDVLGRTILHGYDTLNRQVKVIRNASDPDYDTSVLTGDPDLSDYVGSGAPDLDIVTATHFDDEGRVFAQVDSRSNETRFEYDELGRRVQTIINYDDGSFSLAAPDLDLKSTSAFDIAGRILAAVDPGEVETRFEYDELGRRVRTIVNYVDGVFNPALPDEDVISITTYDKAGQVIHTQDPRGTLTQFGYDQAGRRLTVTRAAETSLAVTSYTCYDKAGRVLRAIEGWIDDPEVPAPDAQDGSGEWLFDPAEHGHFNDQNLIMTYTLDKLGRVTAARDVLGQVSTTSYAKEGTVQATADPLGRITSRRYDRLGRLTHVIQNHDYEGEDPSSWKWNASAQEWRESDEITTIDHNPPVNDLNVIVETEYDEVGRMIARRDPNGNRTEYAYDLLDRRTQLAILPDHPTLERVWETSYADLAGGAGTRVTLTDPGHFDTQREFDRLGRLTRIDYLSESPKLTPDVEFTYDASGSRVLMSETNGASVIRKTHYLHDDLRRLVAVGFDEDGDNDIDQTVQYEYDAGGQRTRLVMPGGLEVIYTYNARGELIQLADWDEQSTRYTYDLVGRLLSAQRSNRLFSRYHYDAAGRLRLLAHQGEGKTLGYFAYDVDARGNRTSVVEALPHPGTGETTLLHDVLPVIKYGTWTASGGFGVTIDLEASLRAPVFGDELRVTLGVGPDHGLCEIYLNHTFWEGIDCYAASPDEREVEIILNGEGPHVLDIRNQAEKNPASSGFKLRVKEITANRHYDLHVIRYLYDGLSRLTDADYFPGDITEFTPYREYHYAYDLAGNRTGQELTDHSIPTSISYTYNALNQMTGDGTNTYEYDDLGNLWKTNSTVTHTWDRANRLLSFGGVSSAYNGEGQRVSQTVNSVVKKYLLDVQPSLWKVLADTEGTNTTRYLHGPLGLQSQEQPDGNWVFPIIDALGSVRDVMDAELASLESRLYSPYGEPFGTVGASNTAFGFTNEPTDSTGLLNLRARNYNPAIGSFFNQDPSWKENNLYQYALGNPTNFTDPSGLWIWRFGTSIRESIIGYQYAFNTTGSIDGGERVHHEFDPVKDASWTEDGRSLSAELITYTQAPIDVLVKGSAELEIYELKSARSNADPVVQLQRKMRIMDEAFLNNVLHADPGRRSVREPENVGISYDWRGLLPTPGYGFGKVEARIYDPTRNEVIILTTEEPQYGIVLINERKEKYHCTNAPAACAAHLASLGYWILENQKQWGGQGETSPKLPDLRRPERRLGPAGGLAGAVAFAGILTVACVAAVPGPADDAASGALFIKLLIEWLKTFGESGPVLVPVR